MSPAVPKTSTRAAAKGASGWRPQSTSVPSTPKSTSRTGAGDVAERAAKALLPPARRLLGRQEGGDAALAVGGGARLGVRRGGPLQGVVERAAEEVEQQALGAGDRLGAAGLEHLGGERRARRGQVVRRYDAVDQADGQRLASVEETREEQQLADVRAAQAQRQGGGDQRRHEGDPHLAGEGT